MQVRRNRGGGGGGASFWLTFVFYELKNSVKVKNSTKLQN